MLLYVFFFCFHFLLLSSSSSLLQFFEPTSLDEELIAEIRGLCEKSNVPLAKEDAHFSSRKLRDVLRELMAEPAVAPHLVSFPLSSSDDNGHKFTSYVDAQHFAETFKKANEVFNLDDRNKEEPLTILLPIASASDEFILSSWGNRGCHIMYLQMMGLPLHQRRRYLQTVLLFPFLPFPSKTTAQRSIHRKVCHATMKSYFSDIIAAWGDEPIILKIPGLERNLRILPLLSVYIADYVEATKLSTITGGHLSIRFCFRCDVLSAESLRGLGEPRTEEKIAETIARGKEECKQQSVMFGVENGFFGIPHCSIFTAMALDILHIFSCGLFPYLREATMEFLNAKVRSWKEIMDAYFLLLPISPGLRRPSTSSFSACNGRDNNNISIFFPFALAYVLHKTETKCDILVRAWFQLLAVFEICRKDEFYDGDFVCLEERVGEFTATIEELIDCKETLGIKKKTFRCVKLHLLHHTVECVKLFGPLKGFSSADAEREHQKTKEKRGCVRFLADFNGVLQQLGRHHDKDRQVFGVSGKPPRNNNNKPKMQQWELFGKTMKWKKIATEEVGRKMETSFSESVDLVGKTENYFRLYREFDANPATLQKEKGFRFFRCLPLVVEGVSDEMEKGMIVATALTEKRMIPMCVWTKSFTNEVWFGQLLALFTVKDSNNQKRKLAFVRWFQASKCSSETRKMEKRKRGGVSVRIEVRKKTCTLCSVLYDNLLDGSNCILQPSTTTVIPIGCIGGVCSIVPHPAHANKFVLNSFAAAVCPAYV